MDFLIPNSEIILIVKCGPKMFQYRLEVSSLGEEGKLAEQACQAEGGGKLSCFQSR